MSKIEWKSEKRLLKDLIPAPYNPRQLTEKQVYQSTINVLTKPLLSSIIDLCDKSILLVNSAVRNLSAKRPAKAGLLVFALSNATENLSHILRSVYLAANSFITTQINFSVQWLVRESINKASHFRYLIARLYLWLVQGGLNLINTLNGKVMTWDMEPCMNGFTLFWVHQWFARVAEVKKILINKFIGLIKVVIIDALKLIGFVYASNATKNMMLVKQGIGEQSTNRPTPHRKYQQLIAKTETNNTHKFLGIPKIYKRQSDVVSSLCLFL